MSPKDFSQRVQADDPSIDIFQGAWSMDQILTVKSY